jgi:hypothetical protein
MTRTDFDPARHGFRFGNAFVNHIGFGPVRWTAHGRCGGMAYAALDFFHAGRDAPQDQELPSDDSPLGRLIRERQIHSLINQAPGFLNGLLNPFGWRSRALFRRGLRPDGPLGWLRRTLETGRPVPLGLIGLRFGLVNTHHQVVAFGCAVGPREQDLRIALYDPNYPNTELELRADPDSHCFRTVFPDGGAGPSWLTWFADRRYRPRLPGHP